MLKLHLLFALFAIFYFDHKVWSQDFKAAVVELNPLFQKNPLIPEVQLMKNVELFKEIANRRLTDYDIIVFPESVLHFTGSAYQTSKDIFPYSTVVPHPKEYATPCDDRQYTYASYLKELSCLAKSLKKFLVINLAENFPCRNAEDCPKVGYYVYNTNVVFDYQGKVVARYRKFNLFGEYYLNKPDLEAITFDLKPDVKVGIFTCFDLIFKQPAIDLVRQKKVQAVVFPLMWYSELPFLTALQSQQQWAREFDIVLLAAGANFPLSGTGGSGIYQGKNMYQGLITSKLKSQVVYDYIDIGNHANANDRSTDLSIGEIDLHAKEMDSFHLLKDDLRSYTSIILDTTLRTFEKQVCNGELPNQICCDFSIENTVDEQTSHDGQNHYVYHLVAFSGVRTFSGLATGGIETCAVIACVNETVKSCGERFPNYDSVSWPLTFTKIEVKGIFVKDTNRSQFPNSLLSNIHPLPIEESDWVTQENETTVERKHILLEDQKRLLTFGIFGRDFNRDGHTVTIPPSEATLSTDANDKNKDTGGGAGLARLELAALSVACLLFLLNICIL